MSDSLDTDGADAFLGNLMADEPAGEERDALLKEAGVDPKASKPEPEADPEEAFEPGEKEPEAAAAPVEADPDDAEIAWKDGEKDTKAKLRDLKAAFAAREATTAREADVTARSASVLAAETKAQAALTAAQTKAAERWAPYASIDWLALSRDTSIDAEAFGLLRKDAEAARADYAFYTNELDGVVAAKQREAQAKQHETAQATVAALSAPETGIKGWSPALYQEVLAHATGSLKVPQDVAGGLVNEWAIRALYKAMMYDRGAASTAEKMEKVAAKPVRVLAAGGVPEKGGSAAEATKVAMAKLRRSGSDEDAEDAFLASMRAD